MEIPSFHSVNCPRTIQLGVSLKMYLDYDDTMSWCRRIAGIAREHPALMNGLAKLFILPSFPALNCVRSEISDTNLGLGAQHFHSEDEGPYTGEVSGRFLRQLGCEYVEIGHAERRSMFGETDEIVSLKVAAAWRNDLVPLLCVGELEEMSALKSAHFAIDQIQASLVASNRKVGRMIVAYEPVWAIGASEPAGVEHISYVCVRLKNFIDSHPRLVGSGSSVIYGGSAGPGLLTELGGSVDGLFLGRFAHNPNNVIKILDEISDMRHVHRDR